MRRWRVWAAAAVILSVAGLAGCVTSKLPNVALTPSGAPAAPPILGAFGADPPVADAAAWETRRAPLLREAFQANIYGRFPDAWPTRVASRTTLSERYAGLARLEQWDVALGGAAEGLGFSMVLMLPAEAKGPVPIIVMENFCGNASVFPDVPGVAGPRQGGPKECGNPWMEPVVKMIFGDAIMQPPFEKVLGAGWGLAMLYAGDVVPDDGAAAPPLLTRLTPAGAPPEQRSGAIAVWASLYLRALDALSTDPRLDASRVVLWGHSRNGKAALLAAAMDPRPAGVIALQAGTAGGSLGRDDVGESIAEITKTYPHWFSPAYAGYAGRQADLPVDQHQLLGLIAPRPVLLEGARRDQWSDPIGAYRAAVGAAPVYALYGAPPFAQPDLRAANTAHPLATYMRPGLHGVHGQDWDVALEMLAARWPAQPAAR